jgi:hypothetical protein
MTLFYREKDNIKEVLNFVILWGIINYLQNLTYNESEEISKFNAPSPPHTAPPNHPPRRKPLGDCFLGCCYKTSADEIVLKFWMEVTSSNSGSSSSKTVTVLGKSTKFVEPESFKH